MPGSTLRLPHNRIVRFGGGSVAIALLQAASRNASDIAFRILGKRKFEALAQALRSEDVARVRAIVDDFLCKAIYGETRDLESLVQARQHFEEAACLLIASEPDLITLDKVRKLQNEMQQIIVRSREIDLSQRRRFWTLDCEFHVAMNELGRQTSAELIVQAIQMSRVPYGLPANRNHMQAIYEEHDHIIDSVQSGDKKAIGVAIREHILIAYRRWLEGLHTDVGLMSQFMPQFSPETLRKADSAERQENEPYSEFERDCLCWDLQFQLTYPNEYVLYRRVAKQVNGIAREFRDVLFHNPNWDEIAEQTRRIAQGNRDGIRVNFYAA